MTIAVRPGHLDDDRLPAISLLARHLNPSYNAARFDWLYTRNPAGPGRLWIALDTTTRETIGTAAAFPRFFSIGGQNALCWVLGDFCVSDRYRTLGPAIKLQRVCLELASGAGTAFCYDFPSQAMMSVYERLRIAPLGRMRRLAKLLRVESKLAGLPFPARGIAGVVDRILAFASRPASLSGLALALHEGPCGDEFSRLAEAESQSYGVCLKRSAAYLNWRYRENPTARHQILTARLDGDLVGYAVFTDGAEDATLVDLFGTQDRRVLMALVHATAVSARNRGCATMSVSLLDSHPWVAMFRKLGFVPRESSPLVLSTSADSTLNSVVTAPAGLFLTYGDRDS